ncbi:zinc finger protein 654 isoform X2 [Hyperolius riggenbachi]|uniref:zinc finger protein 654 isoform X2 n=1 Tax=Hyperolius riggenbachi TaxID=752182 RepID=UPI0035A393CA
MLSLFELLLFFGKDEFYETPLKDILGSVQECHDLLLHYDNTDLRLAVCVIKDGGPWEDPVLQAILKGKTEPEDIVDRYLMSENELFFEFRVRYLIALERISEAVALITTCLSHPEVSKNLYYHQAYFTCLYMTKLTDKLLPEHVLRIDPSDGVKIICSIEKEGKTALAMQLTEAFLVTQLQTGKMYSVWELVFIWSKLQLKTNPSQEAFVEQCYNMLRIAANVKVIFPFMKVIRDEVGEAGVQLSVELCGCALQLDLHDDNEAKCLIYKAVAHLFPTDLEICRICALSVFFLQRTVESYRDVERLYKCSDEDYNEFNSCVENRVRFELLPILKRGLLFDPEFWNFEMIQQNCIQLLGNNADSLLAVTEPSNNMNQAFGDKAGTDTMSPKPLDNVVQQTLPLEDSIMGLRNGILKHKEASHKLKLLINSKENHVVQGSYKNEHNVPWHPCILCKKEFLGGHIFRHAQTHQEGGVFTCVLCARKFRNKINMLRHLKFHLKKLQRQHMTNLSADSAGSPIESYSDNSQVNLSEESWLTLQNGNTSISSNEGLTTDDLEEPAKEFVTPGKNQHKDRKLEHLNHSVATQTSFTSDVSNADEIAAAFGETEVEQEFKGDVTECIKLNGSLYAKSDPVVNSNTTYPCPAQGCNRLFDRVRALNKHARKAHPMDVNVQQHIMAWNKGKCRFCLRKFSNARHFIDHLKRHIYPKVYCCPQQGCTESFKFALQLSEHKASHTTFKVQCDFANCTEVFEKISLLHEHEALHYEQTDGEGGTPLPNEKPVGFIPTDSVPQLDSAGNQQLMASSKKAKTKRAVSKKRERKKAENKQTKTEKAETIQTESKKTETIPRETKKLKHVPEEMADLPVPIWKSRKDVIEPKTYKQTEKKINGEVQINEQAFETSHDISETSINLDMVQETPPASLAVVSSGCTVQEQTVAQVGESLPTENRTETDTNRTLESNTAEDSELTSTANDEPSVLPKPNPVNKSLPLFSGHPFRRPLPSSYLDEQYISMPKRRKSNQDHKVEVRKVPDTPPEKLRCGKCLTNYGNSEELKQHLAQKKCQSYFGFDSDDESAW